MVDTEETTRRRGLADLLHRVDIHERNLSDQGRSITSVVETSREIVIRLQKLEEAEQSRRIVEARESERDVSLYQRLDRIEAEVEAAKRTAVEDTKAIRADINKVLMAFVTAVVGGAGTFVVMKLTGQI